MHKILTMLLLGISLSFATQAVAADASASENPVDIRLGVRPALDPANEHDRVARPRFSVLSVIGMRLKESAHGRLWLGPALRLESVNMETITAELDRDRLRMGLALGYDFFGGRR